MRIRTITNTAEVDPKAALLDAARAAVRSAARTEFNLDPLLSPEISHLGSVIASAIKRQGPLLERALGETLKHGGLTVLRNQRVPITRGTLALVNSKDPNQFGGQIGYDDNEIVNHADADLITIDEKQGWAAMLQIKRGGGLTETKKRKADERGLYGARMTLASYLRQEGYRAVDYAEVGVIDVFGQSGYDKDLVIPKSELDEFFGLSVTPVIDEVTTVMRETLDAELHTLLRPVIAKFASAEAAITALGIDAEPAIRLRGRRAILGVDTPLPRETALLRNGRHN